MSPTKKKLKIREEDKREVIDNLQHVLATMERLKGKAQDIHDRYEEKCSNIKPKHA